MLLMSVLILLIEPLQLLFMTLLCTLAVLNPGAHLNLAGLLTLQQLAIALVSGTSSGYTVVSRETPQSMQRTVQLVGLIVLRAPSLPTLLAGRLRSCSLFCSAAAS